MRAFGRTLYLNKMYRRCSLMGGAKKKRKRKRKRKGKKERLVEGSIIDSFQSTKNFITIC